LNKHFLTYVLLAGLGVSGLALANHLRSFPFPGNQEGYTPEQPIKFFSHKQHAGDLGISCVYCHYNAGKSPHAGIPPANLCMNCHNFVTASADAVQAEKEEALRAVPKPRPERPIVSKKLEKLYEALGFALDADGKMKRDESKEQSAIRWVKVHNLPQYTRFDHRAHVSAGVKCQDCHGPVEKMDVISQSFSLSMGWCVKCHKDHKEIEGKKVSPSTDCAACHY
jgi:Cytochrome c7 and related cytochrome c